MTQFIDRQGRPLDHDPFACDPGCYGSHDIPGEVRPPYTAYAAVLAQAARQDPKDWTFKRQRRYMQITEHTHETQAVALLDHAKHEFPNEWPLVESRVKDLVTANDSLGDPWRVPVNGLVCSPQNFRYLYHSMLVLDHLRHVLHHGLNSFHVIELGGGYGGMAYYFTELAPAFNIKAQSYTTIDLGDAAVIAQKYAQALGFPLRALDGGNLFAVRSAFTPLDNLPRFFISAYGFAEFDPDLQEYYTSNVIDHCEHGWLAWNYSSNWPHRPPNPVYAFTERPMTIEPERPDNINIGAQSHFVWF